MVVPRAASSASGIALAEPDPASAYWRFHSAVRRAQLIAWLPSGQRTLIDVSGPNTDSATIAAVAGHSVIRVVDQPSGQLSAPAAAGHPVNGQDIRDRLNGTRLLGRLAVVAGEAASLGFLPDGQADGVIAADRTLSTHLVAESMLAEIARVLRPGGRVFACVDSLVLGMALLADQHHWPHLADLPRAEVVLVPWPDGVITRCYSPDLLRELFIGAGLAVDWIRPLTALSPSMVDYALRRDPGSMPDLVRAELRSDPDDSHGAQLMISAHRRH